FAAAAGAVVLDALVPYTALFRSGGCTCQGRVVGQIGAVGAEPVRGTRIGGQRRRQRVDDRVLLVVAALGGRVGVVGVAALVAGGSVVDAGRRHGGLRRGVVDAAG